MNITNRFEMPDAYARLVRRKEELYARRIPSGRLSFSVTTLADSAWKYKLTKLHQDEVESDVVDYFLAFRGSMMHQALEGSGLQNSIPEPSLGIDVNGVWVSGQADLVLPGVIEDYKMKTVEALFYHRTSDTDALARQLNPYRLMLWKVFRMPIERLTGHIFLMNWVKRRATIGEHGYPTKPHFEIDVPVWSYDDTEAYLQERVNMFLKPIEETESCSPEERWQQKPVFACMKIGNKRSAKNCETLQQATAWIAEKGEKSTEYFVAERPGTDSRCTGYCAVNTFCPYWIEKYSTANILPAEDALPF